MEPTVETQRVDRRTARTRTALREALAEDLMLGARMSCGLSRDLVCRSREVMGTALDDTLASLIADGFLTGDLVPTQKGWLLGNELYGAFWGLATGEVTTARC